MIQNISTGFPSTSMAFDVQQLCLDIPKVYRAMRGAAEAKDQHLGATGKTDRWSVQTLGVIKQLSERLYPVAPGSNTKKQPTLLLIHAQ